MTPSCEAAIRWGSTGALLVYTAMRKQCRNHELCFDLLVTWLFVATIWTAHFLGALAP